MLIRRDRYYIRGSVIPVEEDLHHEFKGHRWLSDIDQKRDTRKYLDRYGNEVVETRVRTRSPLSRHLCGMLNTGQGGTFFLGVSNAGRVEGFMMSVFQIDHFRLALHDLLGEFKPAVPQHMYQVQFVPVVDDPKEAMTFQTQRMDDIQHKGQMARCRNFNHKLRESRYCWCDIYSGSAIQNGLLLSFFVIEVRIHPWRPDDPRNQSLLSRDMPEGNPFFRNERGQCYLRRNGQTKRLSAQEVTTLRRELKVIHTSRGSFDSIQDSGIEFSTSN